MKIVDYDKITKSPDSSRHETVKAQPPPTSFRVAPCRPVFEIQVSGWLIDGQIVALCLITIFDGSSRGHYPLGVPKDNGDGKTRSRKLEEESMGGKVKLKE